jgi:hypothetical protein
MDLATRAARRLAFSALLKTSVLYEGCAECRIQDFGSPKGLGAVVFLGPNTAYALCVACAKQQRYGEDSPAWSNMRWFV